MQKVALLIDWANARGADFRKVIHRARELGDLEFAAAYGAWGRQETRDSEKLFLALGVDMLHCPRWPVGKHPDGALKFKCTDDSLLHRDLLKLFWTQPQVNVFVLAGADTDSLASACLAANTDRKVLIMFNPQDGSLGHVMRLGEFGFEELPMEDKPQQDGCLPRNGHSWPGPSFVELPGVLIESALVEHDSNVTKRTEHCLSSNGRIRATQ
jgi:hypothetical protein